jgi:hypothetical protein
VIVSVGGAGVGLAVSVESAAGGAEAVASAGIGASAAVATGAEEGSVQAVSRKTKTRERLRKFFIAGYLCSFFHSMKFYSSLSPVRNRENLSSHPSCFMAGL